MSKTDRQLLLEFRHGKPIRELIETALEQHQGHRFYKLRVAMELEVSPITLGKWADSLGIDLEAYGPKDDETQDEPIPVGAVKP